MSKNTKNITYGDTLDMSDYMEENKRNENNSYKLIGVIVYIYIFFNLCIKIVSFW